MIGINQKMILYTILQNISTFLLFNFLRGEKQSKAFY